ncbi:hypothetical protein [Nocardia sp. NPDC052566]|uniref:hypothetical protein n=1 Tax=Nocardia sp. NPDC052566 TaxID=3364330 RepID=UPI0037CAEF8D
MEPYSVAPQRVKPSGWWYAAVAFIIVAAIVGGGALGGSGALRSVSTFEDYQRVEVPGSGTVQLTESGNYTVYFEYPGATGDAASPPVIVTITGPDGKKVRLEAFDSKKFTYTYNDRTGRGKYDFQITRTGAYQVTTSGTAGVTVAIGKGGAFDWLKWLLGGLGIIFGGLILGIGFLIVIAIRRGTSKRRLRAASAYRHSPPARGPREY